MPDDLKGAVERLSTVLERTPSQRYSCGECGFVGGAEEHNAQTDACSYCGQTANAGGPDHCETCGNSNFMGYACPRCEGRYSSDEEEDCGALHHLGSVAREVLPGLLAHLSRIQEENERRPPDEMTEDALTTRAKAMLAHKGWAPGDRPSLYSTMRLMVDFGLELTRAPETARCAHPACGCDVDAVCNAALASQEQGGPGHEL